MEGRRRPSRRGVPAPYARAAGASVPAGVEVQVQGVVLRDGLVEGAEGVLDVDPPGAVAQRVGRGDGGDDETGGEGGDGQHAALLHTRLNCGYRPGVTHGFARGREGPHETV